MLGCSDAAMMQHSATWQCNLAVISPRQLCALRPDGLSVSAVRGAAGAAKWHWALQLGGALDILGSCFPRRFPNGKAGKPRGRTVELVKFRCLCFDIRIQFVFIFTRLAKSDESCLEGLPVDIHEVFATA